MSAIDVVLLVAAVLFAITGWRRGLVYGLLSLIGFLTENCCGGTPCETDAACNLQTATIRSKA